MYIFFIHPFVDRHLGCSHEKGNQKKAGVAILISDKINFKDNCKRQGRHYLMIKGSSQEEDITIVNICTLNIGAPISFNAKKSTEIVQTEAEGKK